MSGGPNPTELHRGPFRIVLTSFWGRLPQESPPPLRCPRLFKMELVDRRGCPSPLLIESILSHSRHVSISGRTLDLADMEGEIGKEEYALFAAFRDTILKYFDQCMRQGAQQLKEEMEASDNIETRVLYTDHFMELEELAGGEKHLGEVISTLVLNIRIAREREQAGPLPADQPFAGAEEELESLGKLLTPIIRNALFLCLRYTHWPLDDPRPPLFFFV